MNLHAPNYTPPSPPEGAAPTEEEILEALRTQGYHVNCQVGCCDWKNIPQHELALIVQRYRKQQKEASGGH